MTVQTLSEGGCLCGEVRYAIAGAPFAAEYCHCGMCQKVAGSAFAVWMDVRAVQLTWKKGAPTEYRSSTHVFRGFCAVCGTTLSFRDDRHPAYRTLSISSLDNPHLVRPTYHIYTESQMDWLVLGDDCKRFARGPEESSTP